MRQQKILTLLILSLFLTLLIAPAISAYNGWDVPGMDVFENEWVKFTLIFIALFGIMYFAMYKPYTSNIALVATISASLSLLITITILRRGFLYSFTGEGIGSWIVIIGFIIAGVALFRFFKKYFDKWWWLFGIITIFVLFVFVDMWEILPESMQYGPIGDFISMVESFSGIIIIILIVLAILKVVFWAKRTISGTGGNINPAQAKQVQRAQAQQARQMTQMRRGGTGPKRSRFISNETAQRYARKYGKRAARKRFGY